MNVSFYLLQPEDGRDKVTSTVAFEANAETFRVLHRCKSGRSDVVCLRWSDVFVYD